MEVCDLREGLDKSHSSVAAEVDVCLDNSSSF